MIVIGKEERNRGSMKLPPYNNPNIEDRGGRKDRRCAEKCRAIFLHMIDHGRASDTRVFARNETKEVENDSGEKCISSRG